MKIDSKKFIRSIEKGTGIYKIYAILSLDIKDVIYIGQTKGTLGNRLSAHKTYLNRKDICIMLITNTDNQSDESKYIKIFKDLGFNLLNKNNGISEKLIKEKKEKLSKEKKSIKAKEYYIENKERLKENMIKYQEENKERLKEYRKEYYKNKRSI